MINGQPLKSVLFSGEKNPNIFFQFLSPPPKVINRDPPKECFLCLNYNGWSQRSIPGIVNLFLIFSSNQNVTKRVPRDLMDMSPHGVIKGVVTRIRGNRG